MRSGALPVDTSIDDFVSSKQNKVLAGALGLFTPGCVPSHCHKHTYRSGNRQVLSRAHLCLCGGLMSSAVWPAETLYLHSLITALQQLPLLLGGCRRRRCWSGSLCDHRLHLRLLRKHLCHTSWNRVVQGCVCSTCQWWLWVAEISYKTRLRSSKLQSLDRREGWGDQGENHQGNIFFLTPYPFSECTEKCFSNLGLLGMCRLPRITSDSRSQSSSGGVCVSHQVP